MECKFDSQIDALEKYCGINRYIMECKFNMALSCFLAVIELIDTLWNVNLKGFETVSPYPAN